MKSTVTGYQKSKCSSKLVLDAVVEDPHCVALLVTTVSPVSLATVPKKICLFCVEDAAGVTGIHEYIH